MHDESVTISIDLLEAKRICQALQQDRKECEATTMEINVASLINQLKEMTIQPLTTEAQQSKLMNKNG